MQVKLKENIVIHLNEKQNCEDENEKTKHILLFTTPKKLYQFPKLTVCATSNAAL